MTVNFSEEPWPVPDPEINAFCKCPNNPHEWPFPFIILPYKNSKITPSCQFVRQCWAVNDADMLVLSRGGMTVSPEPGYVMRLEVQQG